jgi:type II secretory pathway component GspD/PulD (secretin)
VASLGVTGGALQGLAFGGRFNFSGLFDFLQTYGDTKTTQNVLLKTVSGNKVSFKSLTQIPYVSEIGVTTSTSSNNNTALGSTQTDKADDGIEVDMTPRFDASANTVTIDMKLSIKAVLAFNQLSAGNQLGTLTQPTTADRSFTDILRMRPGQTVVVGGLQYDSVTNDHNSPLFLQDTKAEHQALTISRQSMFIVVRSNVARIGQVLEDGNDDLKSSEYLELPTAAHDLPSQAQKKPAARAAKTVAAQ